MTSPRHPGSRLRTALRWAVAVYVGLAAVAAVAAQGPQGGQEAALALVPAWTAPLPEPPVSLPAHDRDRLYVPLRSERIVAIALDSGTVAWEVPAGPDALVAAGDGLVFVALRDAVIALDATSGAERWRHPVGAPVSAPPAWNNGWLLVGTEDGRATMLRAAEGRPLWERDLRAVLRPGTVMTGERLYAILDDGRVTALTLDRGTPIWERKLPASGTALTALDDRVFVGAEDRFFYCLSSENGKVRWRWRAGGAILGTPVVDEEAVYFLSLDNVLRALDRGNGHQRWKRGLSFRPIGGPILAGDSLLVPGLTPEIPAFRTAKGAPAGKMAAPDEPLVSLLLVSPPETAPAGSGSAGSKGLPFSLVLVTRESVRRFDPAPPVLESRPIPGVPTFLPLASPQRDGQTGGELDVTP